jgi:hypothetical protein
LEKVLAKRLLDAALSLDKALGVLDTVISEIPDEPEKRSFAKSLGTIMLDVNEAFIRPVARRYPDLDPDPI